MCKCIAALVGLGYVSPNLLKPKQYLLYPIITTPKGNKVGKTPLLIYHCPVCGEKLED